MSAQSDFDGTMLQLPKLDDVVIKSRPIIHVSAVADNYLENASRPLPSSTRKTTFSRRHIDFSWTTYKKIFLIITLCNLPFVGILLVHQPSSSTLQEIDRGFSINLLLSVLARQENCVNLLYALAVRVPHTVPLSVRRRVAKIFHYGGVHSGCGVAATTWTLVRMITQIRLYSPVGESRVSTAMTCLLPTFFAAITLSAVPSLRRRWHNGFEIIHRFGGWAVLVTLWVRNILAIWWPRHSLSHWNNLSMWCLTISTFCGILSWSRLRRRDVEVESISSHAIRIHFRHANLPPFNGIKVSNRPLLEWHSFPTFPEPTGGFSILVSKAGDWTEKIINKPPKTLWVRGAPIRGVSYAATLFRKVVIVATGSGIAPVMSLFYSKTTPCRILWSTHNPVSTYGPRIVNAVLEADPSAVIWDTQRHGRPDLVQQAWRLLQTSNAEAVFVISNRKVTKMVVPALQRKDVPAYGVLFDS